MRQITTAFLAGIVALAAPAIAFAAEPNSAAPAEGNAQVEAVIRHHVEALNSGNPDLIAQDWDAQGTLVDAFPPFVWEGSKPTVKWWSDLQAAIRPVGLDSVKFTVLDWQRIYVRGDSAYAVASASAIISGPKFAVEAKGSWTFVLKRVDQSWKIVSWNWGGPPAAPIKK